MREIKFRGYSEIDSEWREGSYSTDGVTHEIHTLMKAGALYASQVPVDSIGQYTGLKDKNGEELYEGDIISIQGHNSAIGCENSYVGFYFWSETCNGFTSLAFLLGYKNFEVVGNIYENPELIEDDND